MWVGRMDMEGPVVVRTSAKAGSKVGMKAVAGSSYYWQGSSS